MTSHEVLNRDLTHITCTAPPQLVWLCLQDKLQPDTNTSADIPYIVYTRSRQPTCPSANVPLDMVRN